MLGKKLTVLGLAAGLLCVGDAYAADPIELTEAESGQAIRATVGQELIVTLRFNGSTGYSWSSSCEPADALEPVGEPEYVPDQPVMPGSGGRLRYRFTARLAGEAVLRFEYRRSWEPDTPPAKTATYLLNVGGP